MSGTGSVPALTAPGTQGPPWPPLFFVRDWLASGFVEDEAARPSAIDILTNLRSAAEIGQQGLSAGLLWQLHELAREASPDGDGLVDIFMAAVSRAAGAALQPSQYVNLLRRHIRPLADCLEASPASADEAIRLASRLYKPRVGPYTSSGTPEGRSHDGIRTLRREGGPDRGHGAPVHARLRIQISWCRTAPSHTPTMPTDHIFVPYAGNAHRLGG
jgi:hypothetical protein